MADALLERDADLRVLNDAVDEAAAGRSGVVLVLGEAGIGKTSLMRAFVASVDGRAHVLEGACDDLLTPRTFGPLRDAVVGRRGRLAEALTRDPDREEVYAALLEELSRPDLPTVLIVEDAHWADDATLDALRYLARRLDGLRGVLVLTYRDDEVGPVHGLRRLLGAFATARVQRLGLRRLSRRAVAALGGGTDTASIYAATRGNPFFVTEAIACREVEVPSTVVDAVMARVRRLSPATRTALEQLAVVPSHAEPWLVDVLLGQLDVLDEAEQRGIVEVRPDGVRFRHELARRALQVSIPRARQVMLNRAVVNAMREREDADLSRLVHHAMAAGDVDTVLSSGPAAAREAAHAGSHRQALEHYEHVIAYADLLPEAQRARVLEEYGWQLYAAQRHDEAVEVASLAVTLWEAVGDPVSLGQTLVVLSRSAFMADRPGLAIDTINRAVQVLTATGDLAGLAYAQTYRGAVLALTDRQEEALAVLDEAHQLAEQSGRRDLIALILNYVGCARVDLRDPQGIEDLRTSLAMALALPHYEYAARAYTNLGEALFQLRRYDELETCIAEGLHYAAEHDLPGHAYNLEAHRAMLLALRGQWDAAETRLRRLVAAVPDPGQLARLTLPTLGRLLARRGDPGAADVLDRAWRLAERNGTLLALGPAGLAYVEWAWLTGDLDRAKHQIDVLLERTAGPTGAGRRGELLGYLRRAGRDCKPFPGCPPEWDAALRGDWEAAVTAWERIGDPYEKALEQAFSGQVGPALIGLETIDGLGASAAAAMVRAKLRELGVARVPRGRQRATRENPGGLTGRQVEVLALLAEGMTNPEIADELTLSTRTVDHHVSAILTTLGVATRRDAARKAEELGLTAVRSTAGV